MVAQNTERASGQTAAEEVTREETKEAFERIEPELPDERERKFQAPGFARMKFSFSGPDAAIIGAVHDMVDKQIAEQFADAYAIMFELYSLVRTPVVGPGGEAVMGDDGWPEWERTETGRYEEDWTKLTFRQRERFLFQLVTRLFEWEQAQAEGWAESMFAKGLWEQAFSAGFESLENPRATVDARTARGKLEAREQHFLAVFKTYYSRKADAVVRSMSRLEQRLKDVHVTNGSR